MKRNETRVLWLSARFGVGRGVWYRSSRSWCYAVTPLESFPWERPYYEKNGGWLNYEEELFVLIQVAQHIGLVRSITEYLRGPPGVIRLQN